MKNHPSNKVSEENLAELFSYHAPNEHTKVKYARINEATMALARVILETCPECADRSTALREVRNTRMWANASIACVPPEPAAGP